MNKQPYSSIEVQFFFIIKVKGASLLTFPPKNLGKKQILQFLNATGTIISTTL